MPVGKDLMQPQSGYTSQALCCIKSDKHLPSELKSFRQQVKCPRVYPSRVSVFLLCPAVLSPDLMRAGNLAGFSLIREERFLHFSSSNGCSLSQLAKVLTHPDPLACLEPMELIRGRAPASPVLVSPRRVRRHDGSSVQEAPCGARGPFPFLSPAPGAKGGGGQRREARTRSV